MYAFDAAVCGARVVTVPRSADFTLDLDAVEEATGQHRPKLLFVTSPNNPDGSVASDEDLERLLGLPIVVILDEAYVEFAGPERSRIRQVPDQDNLIVLRTFSKLAGLAGLRVGYGAFPDSLMPHLWKIKQPYNVSVAASTAAMAALEDLDWFEEKVRLIVAERARLLRLLESIPYLRPYPTQSNFILCHVVDRDARQLKLDLEQKGILIRHFDRPRLRDHIRISVGKPEHTDILIKELTTR
jgi:histidinol-phosphate aminotransferase